MLLRPILSLRNRIKDIHLKIGHKKKIKESFQLSGQDQIGLGTSRLVSFPRVVTRLKSSAQQPSGQMEISVTPHVSELHSLNCKTSPPLPLWGHPEHIRSDHDMEQTLPNPSSLDVLVLYWALLESWSPTSPEFFPEVETASGCCINFLLEDRDGKWSSPAFETCRDSRTNAHFIRYWKITSHSLKFETAASCSSKDK